LRLDDDSDDDGHGIDDDDYHAPMLGGSCVCVLFCVIVPWWLQKMIILHLSNNLHSFQLVMKGRHPEIVIVQNKGFSLVVTNLNIFIFTKNQ